MAAVIHLLGIGESSNHVRGLPPRVSTTPVSYKCGTSVVLIRYDSGLLSSLGLTIPHFVFAVTTTQSTSSAVQGLRDWQERIHYFTAMTGHEGAVPTTVGTAP